MTSYDQSQWNVAERGPRRGGFRWEGWSLMLFLAWLLFEVTADAALAAVVACARFGWNDFQTALWLRRIDPSKGRGRACFWFHLGAALWKIAATALMVLVILVLIEVARARANRPRAQMPPPEFQAALLQTLMGFVLASGVTAIGTACCLRHQCKMWIDGAVHAARRDSLWPPLAVGRTNHASLLLAVALIPAGMPLIILCFMIESALFGKPGPVDGTEALGIFAIIAATFISPLLLVAWLHQVLSKRVIAMTPQDCWPPDECEFPMQKPSRQVATDESTP